VAGGVRWGNHLVEKTFNFSLKKDFFAVNKKVLYLLDQWLKNASCLCGASRGSWFTGMNE